MRDLGHPRAGSLVATAECRYTVNWSRQSIAVPEQVGPERFVDFANTHGHIAFIIVTLTP